LLRDRSRRGEEIEPAKTQVARLSCLDESRDQKASSNEEKQWQLSGLKYFPRIIRFALMN
jgi:hypothetical protein